MSENQCNDGPQCDRRLTIATQNDEHEYSSDVSEQLNDVDEKARQLLKEFLALAVLVNDYLYKPQEKVWVCLTADLKTFQQNLSQWVPDQLTVDQLDAAIETVVNADLAFHVNMHDLSVYQTFRKNMEDTKMLSDFFKSQSSSEPKLTCVPSNEFQGIFYFQP